MGRATRQLDDVCVPKNVTTTLIVLKAVHVTRPRYSVCQDGPTFSAALHWIPRVPRTTIVVWTVVLGTAERVVKMGRVCVTRDLWGTGVNVNLSRTKKRARPAPSVRRTTIRASFMTFRKIGRVTPTVTPTSLDVRVEFQEKRVLRMTIVTRFVSTIRVQH